MSSLLPLSTITLRVNPSVSKCASNSHPTHIYDNAAHRIVFTTQRDIRNKRYNRFADPRGCAAGKAIR
ncbi:hypothetical protein TNCV_1065571 [Trichonephila clavipes]|nr:hypothetical protein TNCV_1065571 [Trichonephila clavipes]